MRRSASSSARRVAGGCTRIKRFVTAFDGAGQFGFALVLKRHALAHMGPQRKAHSFGALLRQRSFLFNADAHRLSEGCGAPGLSHP
jgi:hypothetical protein